MPFARRLLLVVLIAAAMFAVGTMVYFACRGLHPGSTKDYWAAVALLPAGFAPDQGDDSVPVGLGWLFYALCFLVLLVGRRTKVFWITGVVLILAYCFNLSGCVHLLTS